MSYVADRRELGLFVMQDHRKDVQLHQRLGLAGVRVIDPDGDDDPNAGFVFGEDDEGNATDADFPAWRFWSPGEREIGAWSSGLVARVTGSRDTGKDSKGRTVTGGGVRSTDVRPVRTRDYLADDAFAAAGHVLPDWLPVPAKGLVMLGSAGTREDAQEDVLGWLDPRMIAANRNGFDEMGSMVCDTDPEGEVSARRVARLQGHLRVAHVKALGPFINNEPGWVAAWQHGLTGQGDQAGLGAIYGRLDRGQGQASGRTVQSGRGGATHGVALMARDAWGPVHCGHQNDKHRFDVNDDDEPVNSAHLDVLRHFWYLDQERDGPMEFDNLPYGPVRAPMRVATWLRWDALATHQWNGLTLPGLWRWESESFFTQKTPGGPPPSTPTTPGDPPVPGQPPGGPVTPPSGPLPPPPAPPAPPPPGGPQTPGGPVQPSPAQPPRFGGGGIGPTPDLRPPLRSGDPGYQRPPGQVPGGPGFGITVKPYRYVGAVDRSAFEPEAVAWAPTQLGFSGALVFPQHFGRVGAVDLRLSAMPPLDEIERAQDTTPAVGRWDSWGAETGDGWVYTQQPGYSRVPGGTAAGGMLWTPPEVDQADADDSYAPSGVDVSTSYLGWGYGGFAAWGAKGTAGDMAENSIRAGMVGTNLVWAHRGASSWSTILAMDSSGLLISGALGVGGNVGFFATSPTTQPAPIANATGGATVDSEARTALNALLAAMRTLGLIDT